MIKNIDQVKCTGCGICIEICAMDVLRIDTDNGKGQHHNLSYPDNKNIDHNGKAYIAYPEDCMTCFNCEINCPENAIEVDYNRIIVSVI